MNKPRKKKTSADTFEITTEMLEKFNKEVLEPNCKEGHVTVVNADGGVFHVPNRGTVAYDEMMKEMNRLYTTMTGRNIEDE